MTASSNPGVAAAAVFINTALAFVAGWLVARAAPIRIALRGHQLADEDVATDFRELVGSR